MKHFTKYFCAVVIAITVTSCFSLDSETEIYSDVYIMSKLFDGDTMYTLGGFASANKSMDSAILVTPENTEYSLIQLSTLAYFEKDMSNSEYSNSMPTLGDYQFIYYFTDGTSDGETVSLINDTVSITSVDSIVIDDIYDEITPYWKNVDNADYYRICIYDNAGEAIFMSTYFAADTCAYTISTSTSNWGSPPEGGEKYYLEVDGVTLGLYSSSSNWDFYNIACSDTLGFTWPD